MEQRVKEKRGKFICGEALGCNKRYAYDSFFKPQRKAEKSRDYINGTKSKREKSLY